MPNFVPVWIPLILDAGASVSISDEQIGGSRIQRKVGIGTCAND